jgi:hypothetical protein
MKTASLRALALGLALALAPGCASLKPPSGAIANPIAAAKTADQKAYALIESYALVLEEAQTLVRDARTPQGVKRALGEAERAATPAIETLKIAVVQYLRAKDAYDALAPGAEAQRAAQTLAIAAAGLADALQQAEDPVRTLIAIARR